MNINCTLLNEDIIVCNGSEYSKGEGTLGWHDKWFWIYLGIYVALVAFAGIMSGLTMGLLSIDLTNLKVIATGGKTNERMYAKRIMPIVEKHHLLLVTLLLANAAAVESMPIFLDKITNPAIAIGVSVTAVLIVGEVLPQAVCTRYGLAIGAVLSPLVYLLMVLLFVIAWPIAKILDCVLGKEHGTFFRRAELGVLVDLHRVNHDENEEPLTEDEVLIIKGALNMRSKMVKDAYVPLDRVFMVNIKSKMNQETMKQIITHGHSRIPVYDVQDNTIRGMLLVKTLIELDPDDELPVQQILLQYGHPLPIVPCNMPLYDLLNDMQTGRCHMAAVTSKDELFSEMTNLDGQIQVVDQTDIQGIITLEDILEQILQEDILDETDVLVDVRKATRVARAKLARTNSETGLKVRHYCRAKSEETSVNRGMLSHGQSLMNQPVHIYAEEGGARKSEFNSDLHVPSINADIESSRISDTEPLLQ